MGIKEFLREYGFRFKKKWGQNFITDRGTLEKIADVAEIEKDDIVVEIGAGMGTLTKVLSERAAKVIAIEIDRELIPFLQENLDEEKVSLIQGDALELSLDNLVTEITGDPFCKYKIVANLPYYITTPLLMGFLEKEKRVEKIVAMIQKEVAERLAAKPGGKDYGALTVNANLFAEVRLTFTVSRKVFIPQPEVESAVVELKIREDKKSIPERELLSKIIRAAFNQRRKTLQNALKSLGEEKAFLDAVLTEAQIAGDRRGETLSPEEFIHLSKTFSKIKKEKGKS